MKNIDNQIKEKGTHSCNHNKNYDLFIQFTSNEQITVPEQKPDIEEISSVIVDPEIISLRIVNTAKGLSLEGQQLTGKKIVAEIKLRQKIMYVADEPTQSIHVVENEYYQSAFIVIPTKIEGTDPEILLENNFLQVKVSVEDIVIGKMDERTVAKIVHLLLKVHLVPHYELCYTEDYNCTNSNLYIVHKDGTKKKQLTYFDDSKIYTPQWSPCGQKIAFISKLKKKSIYRLNLVTIKNGSMVDLTDPYTFSFVGSYCWGKNSNILYFSAYYNNTKEIFEMNIPRMEWNQLTYSDSSIQNYKPKLSPKGELIAYLKVINNNSHLYSMKTDGLGAKKLTSTGGVRDFDWSEDSSIIAYIDTKEDPRNHDNLSSDYVISGDKKGDSICLLDIIHGNKEVLPVHKLNLTIRKVLYSPDNRYLAFIGKSFSTENIYLYDLLKNNVINLTNHDVHVEVSDFTWSIDSSFIYYGANDLTYFNVYSVQLNNKERLQISNTMADRILLSYRPRIK